MANNTLSEGKLMIVIFVGVIIATVFLGQIATDVTNQTTTDSLINATVINTVANTSVAMEGRTVIGTPLVTNGSVGSVPLSNANNENYTIDTREVGGAFTIAYTPTADGILVTSGNVTVTYDFEGDGYLQDSGARSVNLLVILFGALAILVFVIVILFMGPLGDMIRNR